ncbi:ribonuclease P/MRP protein subunit POP5 isoform X2 [Corythoichthys intestinalis]|uniref:ribonuclease P/MRP protein subunit POP5 isoform X2 n=1 Tax=Corythoichthys intestinalis TaxID=161448 RepID=UPI0025A4E869|nr:ribonuclease P/MRP protein subunit POP5 isoform X2 [Corythoichthys intestinalis]
MVRFKSRYLLCEINVLDRNSLLLLNDRVVADAVKDAVARIHVKYLNTYTGMVFLRFPKMCYELLWSALPFITSIETHRQKIPCFLNCLHIGGTMRTCQKFLIRYNTRQLHRMLPNCKNEEEKQQIRKAILSCSLVQEGFEDEPDDAVDADDDEV